MKIWFHSGRTQVKLAVSRILFDAKFVNGTRYAGNFPRLEFSSSSREELDDCLAYGNLNVISDRLKAVLGSHSVNAQYLPVSVRRADHVYPYYVLNPLQVVDCIDFQKSLVEIVKERAYRISRLEIDDSKIGGNQLFLLDKTWGAIIGVGEGLAEAIEMASCAGITLIEPSAFNQ